MKKDNTLGRLPYAVKNRIDRLLVDLGGPRPLTYEELATRMGMDKGQLSRVVNGSNMVRLDTLERIANALDVPLATLFADGREPVTTVEGYVGLLSRQHQEAMNGLLELVQNLGGRRATKPNPDADVAAEARRLEREERAVVRRPAPRPRQAK